MTINYALSRNVRELHKRTRIETKTGKLRWRGNWDSDASHTRLRERVRKANPGWMLAAYGPAR